MSALRYPGVVFVALGLAACGDEQAPAAEAGDTQAETGSTGDGDGDGDSSGDGDGDGDGDELAARPNWHEDVAPVVYERCVGCHFDGGIAPFALETYEQAAPWAAVMSDAVSAQIMPPWGALETEDCQPEHGWRDDIRLTDAQIQMFADWVANGSPEGDPANAAALPEPPSLELQDPSAVLQNPEPFTIVPGQDSFICMAIDPGVDQDVWINGVQMIPDNAEVVHHVLMYVDSLAASDDMIDANGTFPCNGFVSFDGSMQIGTWVPGAVPTQTPPNVGFPMPAGSRIVLAYHYHPTGVGVDEFDQSSIALRWTTEKPATNGTVVLFGNASSAGAGLEPGPNDPNGVPTFLIPPDVSDHTETMSVTLPDLLPPIELFSIGTHMHYVGVDMRIWIERDGEEQCLIQTPRWDFNWQRNYDIDEPLGSLPTVQGGDVIRIRCTYDNTLNNQFLVGALAEQGLSSPIPVGLGEESLDEMCLGLFGIATNLPLDQL